MGIWSEIKEVIVPIDTSTCVAQYLRMSSDKQKLSLAYQAAAIRRYAEAHGFKIVETYQNEGRSGLTIKHREGLARLLRDVVSGGQAFNAVLVYDVSDGDASKIRTKPLTMNSYAGTPVCLSTTAPNHSKTALLPRL